MRAPRAALAPAPAQDLYKQLAAPHGSQLLLRLRCHSDLQVARHYGNLQPDAEVAQLYHLAGCHAHTTVAFDLEFASGSGFGYEHEAVPTLQLAVIYTAVVRATAPDAQEGPADGDGSGEGARAEGDGGAAGGGDGGAAASWVVVRRLRVHTIQVPVARASRQLLEATQAGLGAAQHPCPLLAPLRRGFPRSPPPIPPPLLTLRPRRRRRSR